jgi:hypothetical protein
VGVEEEQFQRELKKGTVSLLSLDSPRADVGGRRSRVPRHAVAGALGLGLAGQVSHQEKLGSSEGRVFLISVRVMSSSMSQLLKAREKSEGVWHA